MACVDCDGRGCKTCENRGSYEITGCPQKLICSDVHAALLAADMADKGCYPIAGGWLDQAQCALDVIRFVQSDSARWKLKQLRNHA